jgi:probable HAF family extracellular repeat protein
MFAGVSDGEQAGMAAAVNDGGTIAGVIGTNGVWYVSTWDSSGARHSLTAVPGASWVDAVTVNAQGAVLAWWKTEPDRAQPIFVHDGAIESIGHLSALATTEPFDLNNRGQVVGRSGWAYAADPDSLNPYAPHDTVPAWIFHHPFLWENGALRDLGVFGKTTACSRAAPCARGEALAINDRGEVVGFSEDDALLRRPFLWRDGVMQDLGVLPGQAAVARAINSRGQIAGDGNGIAFLWEDGAGRMLGSLGGGYTEVTALNDAGDVVGTALTPSGEQHAFIYTGGRMIDLGLGLAGACAAKATAVNNRGEVLIAVMRECFHNLADPRLTNFSYVRPQLAVVWHQQP